MYLIKAVRWLGYLHICLYSKSFIKDFPIKSVNLTKFTDYRDSSTIINIKSGLLTIPFPE